MSGGTRAARCHACDLMRPSLSASASRNISSSTFCGRVMAGAAAAARDFAHRAFLLPQQDRHPVSYQVTKIRHKQHGAGADLSRSSLAMKPLLSSSYSENENSCSAHDARATKRSAAARRAEHLQLLAVRLNPLGAKNFQKLVRRHHARGLPVDSREQRPVAHVTSPHRSRPPQQRTLSPPETAHCPAHAGRRQRPCLLDGEKRA